MLHHKQKILSPHECGAWPSINGAAIGYHNQRYWHTGQIR